MQLGARWRVGEPPHRGVPEQLHTAIAESEAAHATGDAWTLTWLEGRPRVELFTSQGMKVDDLRIDASGQVSRSKIHLHEGAGGSQPAIDGGDATDDDDDDDWLK